MAAVFMLLMSFQKSRWPGLSHGQGTGDWCLLTRHAAALIKNKIMALNIQTSAREQMTKSPLSWVCYLLAAFHTEISMRLMWENDSLLVFRSSIL